MTNALTARSARLENLEAKALSDERAAALHRYSVARAEEQRAKNLQAEAMRLGLEGETLLSYGEEYSAALAEVDAALHHCRGLGVAPRR